MAGTRRLLRAAQAEVSRDKLLGYLLSSAHPLGKDKAEFFHRFGFRAEQWEVLATALRKHAEAHPVASMQDTPFGTRYTVTGPLEAPDGRRPLIRTVWFIDLGNDVPRFVTAYPVRTHP